MMKNPILCAAALLLTAAGVSGAMADEPKKAALGKYAEVNGLKMYYEVHGEGRPLILLHGAFATAEGWAGLLPQLSKNRQVIVVELQGHGHTGDIDRPLSFKQMADDTAALLQLLKVKQADVFGYSMGGGAALSLAINHPQLVHKLAILGAGTGATKDVYEEASYKQLKSITPENFNFPQVKDPYVKVAPDPSKWPVLVSKVLKMNDDFHGYTTQEVKSIKAPTLIMMGDRDGVKTEHAVEMYRTIPNSQLAIFPNGDHFVLFMNSDKVLSALVSFLDAPEVAKPGE